MKTFRSRPVLTAILLMTASTATGQRGEPPLLPKPNGLPVTHSVRPEWSWREDYRTIAGGVMLES